MKGAEQLLRGLAEVDRRIDNMRFLVGFQIEKRERILADIRKAIGRDAPDTTAFPDVAADGPPVGTVRLLCTPGGGRLVVRDADTALVDLGVLVQPGTTDHGRVDVSEEEAAALGDAWWRRAAPKE